MKRNPKLLFFGVLGILPLMLLLQRTAYLIVTPTHVIVTRFHLRASEEAVRGGLKLERPVRFKLAEPARSSHNLGVKVLLPPEVAGFLGRKVVYTGFGLVAADAFKRAARPSA